MTSIGDIKWLAGLLEGEGYFGYYPNSGGARIGLGMTDRDVVERASRLMRATGARHDAAPVLNKTYTLNARRNRHGTKPMFVFSVSGARAVRWMMTLFSCMGERRKAKIADSLQRWQAAGIGRKYEPFCKKRHPWDGPRGRGHMCPTCRKEWQDSYSRSYRESHADQLSIRRHERYVANRESILARTRAYAIANPEKTRARQREWYLKNREKVLARVSEYRASKRAAQISLRA